MWPDYAALNAPLPREAIQQMRACTYRLCIALSTLLCLEKQCNGTQKQGAGGTLIFQRSSSKRSNATARGSAAAKSKILSTHLFPKMQCNPFTSRFVRRFSIFQRISSQRCNATSNTTTERLLTYAFNASRSRDAMQHS